MAKKAYERSTGAMATAAALLLAAIAHGQGIPRPDDRRREAQLPQQERRDPRPGDPDPRRGSGDLPVLITFTITPAVIYPGDRVTLRWSVRDRRPNVAWGTPVHLRSSFTVEPALPAPAPNSGSHSFVAGESPARGTFTIQTGGALASAERTVDYTVVQRPSITRLTVERRRGDFVLAGRGTNGDRLGIVGDDFGQRQGDSRVELVSNGRALSMPVGSWSDERIVVTVPNRAPAGAGAVRVSKGGGRLTSNSIQFTVFRSLTITNAMLQLVATALGLGQTAVHLDDGANASSITFSPQMTALGVSNQTFTLPRLEARAVEGARIAASVIFPLGSYPDAVRYSVNDVNSNSVVLGISGGRLVLTIGFESNGPEIEGDLRYCVIAAAGMCASRTWTNDAPDVQVNNASVAVRFTPGAADGALTIASADATFDADFQVGADWEDWLVNLVTGYRSQVRPRVAEALTAAANRTAVRNAISGALMSVLRAQGVNRVDWISANGGNITVVFE